MGIGGVKEDEKPPHDAFPPGQAAPASLPEFKGNVVAVQTAPFWDDESGRAASSGWSQLAEGGREGRGAREADDMP